MSLKDKQKRNILVVLLAVLAVTLVLGYWVDEPGTTAAVQVAESKASSSLPTSSDARIRMDLVEKSEPSEDVGRKNVFQYRAGRPAPPPPTRGGTSMSSMPPNPNPPGINSAPIVMSPPPPPPPPPIPFRYQGFAVVNSTPPALTAFLELDPAHHFNATVGEVFMGRYRIAGITEKAVEVEDLVTNRRQTLPLQK